MRAAVPLPVTVKIRIGVVTGRGPQASSATARFDEADWRDLRGFVRGVAAAGCDAVIVHARKAVLGGLSAKANREIPPLRYDIVRALKSELAPLPVILNGGVRSCEAALEALTWCDGVMLGREAYHRPLLLAELDRALEGGMGGAVLERAALLERMAQYAERQLAGGERLAAITRHIHGLYAGEPGARSFRRALSEGVRDARAGAGLLREIAVLLGTPDFAATSAARPGA